MLNPSNDVHKQWILPTSVYGAIRRHLFLWRICDKVINIDNILGQKQKWYDPGPDTIPEQSEVQWITR